jgi:hypothetical protein
MRPDGGRLVPRDPYSDEIVRGLRRDADVLVQVKQARSVQQVRFLYALLHKIAANHPELRSPDAIMHEIKIRARLFDPIVKTFTDRHTGEIKTQMFLAMRSLSFATMDGAEFNDLFERQIKPIIREHILPGVADDELIREVMETL